MVSIPSQGQLESAGLGNIDYEELLDGAARMNGLELIPQYYDLLLTSGQQASTVRLTPDAADGPLFVTRIKHAVGGPGGVTPTQGAEVDVQIGTRKLTEGRCIADALFGFYTGALAFGANFSLSSPQNMPPLVVGTAQTLSLAFDTLSGGAIGSTSYVQINGFHLRKKGTHERIGSIADQFSQAWLRTFGEFYAIGLLSTAAQTYSSFLAAYRASWQWFVGIQTAALSDQRIRIGGLELLPRPPLANSIAVQISPLRLGNLDMGSPHLLEQRIATAAAPQAYAHFIGARRIDASTVLGG
jgi:hypothetical protein